MKNITEYPIHTFPGDYFIGMNTGHGFVNTTLDVINEKTLDRIYIIKGAAGTGKSTLMKHIAELSSSEGIDCQRYLCSSDPNSLDCIIIDGRIAVLDGTAPHMLDMAYPGGASELVDMTNFWNTQKLLDNKKDIISISDKKSAAFNRAYSLLNACEILAAERKVAISRAFNFEKAEKAAERLIGKLGYRKNIGKSTIRPVRSFGMKGKAGLDTFECIASEKISVSDTYGSGYLFMDIVSERLQSAGHTFIKSPDPIAPDNICDIFIPEEGILITVDGLENPDHNINMSRFIDTDLLNSVRGGIRLSFKCSSELENEAENCLADAGKYHFALEKIYGGAMNFDCISSYSDLLWKNIVSILKR
ncbi:MAG: hypothetical protein HFE30_00445 [Clostridiales bacterium]|nr:hypothetical protein [Clostridiales bacterium]